MPYKLNSEKHLDFKRIAEDRAERFAKLMRLMTNLSSPNYEFNREDYEKLFNIIDKHVNWCREAFKTRLEKEKL